MVAYLDDVDQVRRLRCERNTLACCWRPPYACWPDVFDRPPMVLWGETRVIRDRDTNRASRARCLVLQIPRNHECRVGVQEHAQRRVATFSIRHAAAILVIVATPIGAIQALRSKS